MPSGKPIHLVWDIFEWKLGGFGGICRKDNGLRGGGGEGAGAPCRVMGVGGGGWGGETGRAGGGDRLTCDATALKMPMLVRGS